MENEILDEMFGWEWGLWKRRVGLRNVMVWCVGRVVCVGGIGIVVGRKVLGR